MFIGLQVLPASSVRKAPAAEMATKIRSGLLGSSAIKLRDNVAVDENEPEVLFDGLTHSDEHMGLEMTVEQSQTRLDDSYATTTWEVGGRAMTQQ